MPGKYYLNIATDMGRANGSSGDKSSGDKSPFVATPVDPQTIYKTNRVQESLAKPDKYTGDLDASYNRQFTNKADNALKFSIADWVNKNLATDPRQGNINGKNFYATRNLARLADRFNNEFTFVDGDIGTFDSHGKVLSSGGVQYEQNPQLNTMEQRQYEDSRGIANRLRESDVGIVDTLNRAVPDAYKEAQQRKVNFREEVQRTENTLNKYIRQEYINMEYSKKLQLFYDQLNKRYIQTLPLELGHKAATYLNSLDDRAKGQLIASFWQPSILVPKLAQSLMSQYIADNKEMLQRAGLNEKEAAIMLDRIVLAAQEDNQAYIARSYLRSIGANFQGAKEGAKDMITGNVPGPGTVMSTDMTVGPTNPALMQ